MKSKDVNFDTLKGQIFLFKNLLIYSFVAPSSLIAHWNIISRFVYRLLSYYPLLMAYNVTAMAYVAFTNPGEEILLFWSETSLAAFRR